jgi:hypothetical protein
LIGRENGMEKLVKDKHVFVGHFFTFITDVLGGNGFKVNGVVGGFIEFHDMLELVMLVGLFGNN